MPAISPEHIKEAYALSDKSIDQVNIAHGKLRLFQMMFEAFQEVEPQVDSCVFWMGVKSLSDHIAMDTEKARENMDRVCEILNDA